MDKTILTPVLRGDIVDTMRSNSRSVSNSATSSVYITVGDFLKRGYSVTRIREILWGNYENLQAQLQKQMTEHKSFVIIQETAEQASINYAVWAYLFRYSD